MNKILFVTHESTRTGAPLILLEFIKWLKGNSNFDIFILIVKAGILDDEFKKYGTIINVHELVDTRNKIIFCKLLFRIYNSSLYIRFKEKIIFTYIKLLNFKIIYSNTISNGYVIEKYIPKSYPIITHVHELSNLIKYFGEINLNQVIGHSKFFIADSNLVKSNLIVNHSISEYSIVTITPSINLQKFNKNFNNVKNKREKYILGSSGAFSIEKGSDRIIPVILELVQFSIDFHFVWIGVDLNSSMVIDFKKELTNQNLESFVTLLGIQNNPIDIFCKFDLFILFSREEAFSLVTIENCILLKPVLCYSGVGGPEEILREVPENIIHLESHLDMAKRVNLLLTDRSEYQKVINTMKIQVENNYSHDICFPKLLQVIQDNI